MKTKKIISGSLSLMTLSSSFFLGCKQEQPVAETTPPNVIILLTDDLGYGDITVHGSPTIRTPYIDTLASNGIRFTNMYSSAPVSAPSRRGLMTGRFAQRIVADGNELPHEHMSPEEITLAELFKSNNYNTACIGKWHLGMKTGSHPNDQGFDYYYGTSSSNDHFPLPGFEYTYEGYKNARMDQFNLPLYRQRDTIEIPVNQKLFTKRYTDEAKKWITDNKDTPFFLYLAYNMPHVPLFPSDEYAGKSKGGKFGDAVEEVDRSIGELVETLRDNGIDKNTIIIFSSDNGPWRIFNELGGSSGPFRNGKGTSWEGAFRVPGIFVWPAHIKPSVIMDPVSHIDFFATFSALLATPLPPDRVYDSKNLLPMLLEGAPSPRDEFYYFAEHRNELWGVRKGKYKIHVKSVSEHRGIPTYNDPPLLYDLSDDPAETHNIAEEHPEIVRDLLMMFNNMNRELKAEK